MERGWVTSTVSRGTQRQIGLASDGILSSAMDAERAARSQFVHLSLSPLGDGITYELPVATLTLDSTFRRRSYRRNVPVKAITGVR